MSILTVKIKDAKLFKREIETSEANEARRNRAVKGNNSGGGYIVPATIASHYPVGYDPMGVLTGRRLCDTADNKCREIASNFFVLLLLDYLAIYNDRSILLSLGNASLERQFSLQVFTLEHMEKDIYVIQKYNENLLHFRRCVST